MYTVLLKSLHKLPRLIRIAFLAALSYVVPVLAFAQEGGGGGGGAGEWLSSAAGWLTSPFALIIAKIMQWIFLVVNWLTGILGQIMNWTIEFFILNMSEKINQITAIDSLWQILRDLGNIVFIFLILYAAISTILDSNEYGIKKLLPRIIVVALLVNFSLFFTQLIIDISNVFAIQIYENVSVSGVGDGSSVNISNAIAGQLNLSTIMGDGATEWFGGGGENMKIAMFRAIGAGVVGILGFIFLAFSALITIRFFVLILLMIASPIAFVAFALPDNDFGETWMNYLVSQSFFAPAMMLMLYITLYLGKNMKESEAFSDGNISAAITEPSGNIDILIFYALMIGMLLASLIVARRMGAVGADKAVDYGKSAGGSVGGYVGGSVAGGAAWAGRTTAGRAGRKIADNERLKNAEKRGSWLAQQARRAGEATAGTSFDVRNTNAIGSDAGAGYREGGYDEAVQDQIDFREERKKSIEELSPEEKETVQYAKARVSQAEGVQEDIDEKISDVDSAINNRNELQNKAAKAIDNENYGVLKNVRKQQDKLVEETDGVDRLDDLEDLDGRKDYFEDLKKGVKEQKEEFEEMAEIGQNRGEEYVETMMEQQSALDGIYSAFGTDYTKTTTKTKGNRRMAVDNIENIDDQGRLRHISRMLNNSSGSSGSSGGGGASGGSGTPGSGSGGTGGPGGGSSPTGGGGGGTPSGGNAGASSGSSGSSRGSAGSGSNSAGSGSTSSSSSPSADSDLEQKLSGFPDTPKEFTNPLKQELAEVKRELQQMSSAGMSPEKFSDFLSTPQSKPHVREVDITGDISFQDRNNAGQFQTQQTKPSGELGERKVRDSSELEQLDGDNNN